MQQNLALLGPVATLFSGSRRRWIRPLSKPMTWILFQVLSRITWPWATKLYQYFYSVTKTYIYHERIYPMKRSWREKLRDFAEASHLDVFKQFRKQRISGQHEPGPELRDSRAGQTLGGPPSV